MKVSRFKIAYTTLNVLLFVSILFIGLTSSQPPYDPWLDVTDDGYGGIDDIVATAEHFGALGDPTKNVTIVGHANKLAYTISYQVVPASSVFCTPMISVDGYSKFTICIVSNALLCSYVVYAGHVGQTISLFPVDYNDSLQYAIVKTYDVPNEEIKVCFTNHELSEMYLWLDIYLIP